MEPTDQYNFSLFSPRNRHGRRNRNVILSMLLIWAVAVFGFQFLLRGIEKPVPESSLINFDATWPKAVNGTGNIDDMKTLLGALVHVRGKNTVKPSEQKVLKAAINTVIWSLMPDSLRDAVTMSVTSVKDLKNRLASSRNEEYLQTRDEIMSVNKAISNMVLPYSGFMEGSLEAQLLVSSLEADYPSSPADPSLSDIPSIMKLYLTHNRSVLTDSTFLGFPFHYFYTAVFLLILFVGLCIVYNVIIEWRLKQEGVVE